MRSFGEEAPFTCHAPWERRSHPPLCSEGGAPYVAYGVRTVFVRCRVRCRVRCSVRASRDVRFEHRCDVRCSVFVYSNIHPTCREIFHPRFELAKWRQHPLHPAALASVPYGIVLVRVRVRTRIPSSTRVVMASTKSSCMFFARRRELLI